MIGLYNISKLYIIDRFIPHDPITTCKVANSVVFKNSMNFCHHSTGIRDNLKFEVGDAMNLPYEKETYDIIISSHIYEHVSYI